MENKELFRIGEVSKLFHLSVQTLRHYEEIGLLSPEFIDKKSGYRYYSVRQFEMLTNIRYLRALDLPLNKIAEFIHNRNINEIEEMMKEQKALISQKRKELDLMEQKINHRIVQIQDAKTSQLDKIELVEMPAQRLVWIRDSFQWSSYLSLEHSIRKLEAHQKIPLTFQGKIGIGISKENLQLNQYEKYDLVFLILDDEDTYEGEIEEIPQGNYVRVRFRGSHDRASEYYEKLSEYFKLHQLEITGFSRELTLIDNVISSHPEEFVTEIRIPVSDTSLK